MNDLTRVISANDMHVLTTMFLDAAKEIHVAMCRFDDNNTAQGYLNSALNSVLIGAQQCAKLHASKKVRPKIVEEPEDG